MSTTTATSSAQRLGDSMTLNQVLSWRLHWLLCELWQLQRDIERCGAVAGVAALQTGPFAGLLERLKRTEGAYQRLRWETKTMLSLDYEDDVKPLFDSLPKTAELAAEFDATKVRLQAIVDKTVEREALRLRDAVQRHECPLV